MTRRAATLPDLASLLSMDAERGRIALGRERMILVSADAMGALRRELHDTLGPALAAEVLYRFGRRCGREEAERVRSEWDVRDAARALAFGPLLHAFAGVARVRVDGGADARADPPGLSGTWEDSYEADQHRRLFGVATHPVCSTLAGYASGYASAVLGRELACRETACRAAGADACRWVVGPPAPADRPAEIPGHLRTAYAAVEERLRRQGELLASLADASDEAVYTVDADGTVTSWNPAAERIFGLEAAQVLGRHERLLLPADLVSAGEDRRLGAVAAAERAGPPLRTARTRRVDASGREFPAGETRSPVVDARGRPVGATVVLHPLPAEAPDDVARTLRALLDGVPDGIALTTVDQRVVACNGAFRAMVGLAPEAPLADATCHALLAGSASPCAVCPTGELFQDGMPGRCHPALVRPDGTRVEFDLRSFPLRDAAGRVTHELKVVRDVTRERARDRELEEKRRLASLGEMAARLAHEIKNPLAGMRGALQVLGRRRSAEDPERAVLGEVIAHIDRLDATVRDLLSFARPQQVRREPTLPADVVEAALSLVRESPEMAGLRVAVEDGGAPAVALDRQQAVQVLTNLVLNAAQALRDGDPRDLAVATRVEDGHVVFEVRDRGPGVPAAERGRLFTPFFTTKPRGTGLGLSICRKIAEAHGGTMEHVAPPEGGSAFRFLLPLEPRADEP